MLPLRLAACLGVALVWQSVAAAPAHEHGVARLDPQVATPRGRMKATLRPPQTRVALAR